MKPRLPLLSKHEGRVMVKKCGQVPTPNSQLPTPKAISSQRLAKIRPDRRVAASFTPFVRWDCFGSWELEVGS